MSALQLSRDLNVQYKTAWVLAHKLRESLVDNHDDKLSGEVEMDGAYVNKQVRPANRIQDHVDRCLAKNQNPNKRTVMVLRERDEKGKGTKFTRVFVTKSENQADTIKLALANIERNSTIYADEHMSYDILHSKLLTRRVVHAKNYVGPNGENTNQSESFFSRFSRMQYGQTHKMDNLYMDRYANEAAYREDTRRKSNGDIFSDTMGRCAASAPSRDFAGYWQGNKRVA